MILTADMGNTSITFGLCSPAGPVVPFRIQTRRTGTPDWYGRQLLAKLKERNTPPEAIAGVAMSSVVPDAAEALAAGIRKYLNREPFLVNASVKTGLRVTARQPDRLGPDRLVNAAAAYYYYDGPSLVIDFGTATTYDPVTADGEFPGGVIAPGIGICAEALWEKTARLPRVELQKPDRILGTDTESSMRSGIFYGYVGQVEYLVAGLSREMEVRPTVIATGGLSGLFRDATKAIDVFDEYLTLKGLCYLYRLNYPGCTSCNWI